MTRSKRIYVLDTNVLMHDPTALFKFEEHDVYLPMQVMEELDNGKKGTSEASRTRVLAETPAARPASLTATTTEGLPLAEPTIAATPGRSPGIRLRTSRASVRTSPPPAPGASWPTKEVPSTSSARCEAGSR